jgi:hypothetical protein
MTVLFPLIARPLRDVVIASSHLAILRLRHLDL